MMPGIDGIETLKRIRGQKSASALPVIMVTGKTASENMVEALQLGANDYVTKPVDFAVALARVEAQISRKRAEEQAAFANDELRKANEDLEHRVAERTGRLVEANQKLKIEIAEREELQAKSQYLAYHDSLTGLGNRLLFKEHLEEALADVSMAQQPVAVLFLDLDGFKSVNDTLGHSVGDLLLKSIATKLRDILRPIRSHLTPRGRRICDFADVRGPAGIIACIGGGNPRDCGAAVHYRRTRSNRRCKYWNRDRVSRRDRCRDYF